MPDKDNTVATNTSPSKKGGAFFVAAGIFLSRIAGLIRERAFAHYFGNSDVGDAFKAALKIPNFLQNLFGEGVLSASFIPVYSHLLGKDQKEAATEVSSVVFSWLLLLSGVASGLGIFFAANMIDWIAPGFQGEKRALTIYLVQIFFPGVALLVLSAWCLGILNSHRRFFLSYVAPVVWNAAMIVCLVVLGPHQQQSELVISLGWALVIGSLLQFLFQLPSTIKLVGSIRILFRSQKTQVETKTIFKNFAPAVFARGVVQVAAYIDNMIASYLPTGAVSGLSYAQTIYLLPISLFGMSISAAELPTLSQAYGSESEIHQFLRKRIDAALRRVLFFVVPSSCAFFLIGSDIVRLLFQTGAFDDESVRLVSLLLIAYGIGLLANTQGRIYSSTFYALKNTKRPMQIAVLRVSFSSLLGWFLALKLPQLQTGLTSSLENFGALKWGSVAIAVAASLGGVLEFLLLRNGIETLIGKTDVKIRYAVKLFACGTFAGIFVRILPLSSISNHRVFLSLVAIGIYGTVYFLATYALAIPESRQILGRLLKK